MYQTELINYKPSIESDWGKRKFCNISIFLNRNLAKSTHKARQMYQLSIYINNKLIHSAKIGQMLNISNNSFPLTRLRLMTCLVCPELQDVLLIAGLLCFLNAVAVGARVESVAQLLQHVQVCLARVGPQIWNIIITLHQSQSSGLDISDWKPSIMVRSIRLSR